MTMGETPQRFSCTLPSGVVTYNPAPRRFPSVESTSRTCGLFLGGLVMGSESQQHKLDRVRRPRVQITYDVETNGAMQKVELPFVVGVMADLSGQPKEPLKALKERKVVSIDRDNFNDVL